MSPEQKDFMEVHIQGSRREDVVHLLEKALTHVKGGGFTLSEHPNDYDPFLSVSVPTSWRRDGEPTGIRAVTNLTQVQRELMQISLLFPMPDQMSKATGAVHWRQLRGGPTRDNWAEAMKTLLYARQCLPITTVLMSERMYRKLLNTWGVGLAEPPFEFERGHVKYTRPPADVGEELRFIVVKGSKLNNTILLYADTSKGYAAEVTRARVDFVEG